MAKFAKEFKKDVEWPEDDGRKEQDVDKDVKACGSKLLSGVIDIILIVDAAWSSMIGLDNGISISIVSKPMDSYISRRHIGLHIEVQPILHVNIVVRKWRGRGSRPRLIVGQVCMCVLWACKTYRKFVKRISWRCISIQSNILGQTVTRSGGLSVLHIGVAWYK